MRTSPTDDARFRDEVSTWLRDEIGLQAYRRVVRANETAVVLSKFEEGFSQELFSVVDQLPELFDDAVVSQEYGRLVREHGSRCEAPLRTAVWREASEAILTRLCGARAIDARRMMLVLPGIESVQAVLDAILWSAPTIEDGLEPSPNEASEFAAFEAGARERDLFTRYYGAFEGRPVENYCPGAQFARRLVAQAWRLCTARQGEAAAGIGRTG